MRRWRLAAGVGRATPGLDVIRRDLEGEDERLEIRKGDLGLDRRRGLRVLGDETMRRVAEAGANGGLL